MVVLRDANLCPLPDDLPPEADPAAPPELQAKPGALLEGSPQRDGRIGRLENEEERPGVPGERHEASQLIGGARRTGSAAAGALSAAAGALGGATPGALGGAAAGVLPAGIGRPLGWQAVPGRPLPRAREVEDEEVDRPCLEQRPGHRQRLTRGFRGEDGEPLQAHAPRDRLDGIEAPGEVDPGHERAPGLGLGGNPKGERGRPAGARPAEGDRAGSREAAGREQRVELREARGDHPVRVPWRPGR